MRSPTIFCSLAALLVGCCFLFSGCLQTEITTGKQPSTQDVELPWAHGFVFGIVPPINSPLEVGDQCDNGISEVRFHQPFPQWFVQSVTQSIYTPQRFTVTCASGGTMSSLEMPPVYLLRDTEEPSSPSETTAPSAETAER